MGQRDRDLLVKHFEKKNSKNWVKKGEKGEKIKIKNIVIVLISVLFCPLSHKG